MLLSAPVPRPCFKESLKETANIKIVDCGALEIYKDNSVW